MHRIAAYAATVTGRPALFCIRCCVVPHADERPFFVEVVRAPRIITDSI